MTRRPTRLEQPPPGSRCPACWLALELRLQRAAICPRCYAYVFSIAPGRLQRLAPSDMTRLPAADRLALSTQHSHLITVRSNAWRSFPRVRRP